jgi:hypothetical protein
VRALSDELPQPTIDMATAMRTRPQPIRLRSTRHRAALEAPAMIGVTTLVVHELPPSAAVGGFLLVAR